MRQNNLHRSLSLAGLTAPAMRFGALTLYYGMDYPALAAAEHYTGMVVLQPYHPLVAAGQFAEIFPRADRYLYYNPVKTYGSAAMLDFASERLGPRGDQPFEAWLTCPRDLERQKRAEAERLLAIPGTCGLFVDDLDHWLLDDSRFDQGCALLKAIARKAEGRLILNRGFRFWPELERIDAVLLENVGPYDIAKLTAPGCEQDIRWLHRQLSSYLPSLQPSSRASSASSACPRKSAVPVYTLSYLDQPFRPAALPPKQVMPLYLELKALLDGYVRRHLHSNQALDRWSKPFQPVE